MIRIFGFANGATVQVDGVSFDVEDPDVQFPIKGLAHGDENGVGTCFVSDESNIEVFIGEDGAQLRVVMMFGFNPPPDQVELVWTAGISFIGDTYTGHEAYTPRVDFFGGSPVVEIDAPVGTPVYVEVGE